MFDIKWIRDNRDAFDAGLAKRGLEPLAADLIDLDEKRRGLVAALQDMQERRNAASKEIGQAKAAKDEARAASLMAEVAAIKVKIPQAEAAARAADEALQTALSGIPNLPFDEVPVGPDETANLEVRQVGNRRAFAFEPRQHFELGEQLGLMDFETAAKISGARFVVLKGALARLERALGCFMLDVQTGEHGYTEINPPILVRDDAMFGTAQLPKFHDDQFIAFRDPDLSDQFLESLKQHTDYLLSVVERSGLGGARKVQISNIKLLPNPNRFWLIPTAEVPLTNLARESILEEKSLPMRVTAWTPCFRAEAGAAGKDTRGMIRQHQFSKVELVSITTPEQSAAEHERMTGCAEEILKRLDLAFRTMVLSTGDMGFAARKTYDIEVWLPGQNTWREISSCSNCGDFQARRMNARYRPAEGKGTRFVHTLNGSGLAVGRTLVAVLETYQNADGTITVPAALKPYMGGVQVIGPA
jgi:seryl-tRNA synthetase